MDFSYTTRQRELREAAGAAIREVVEPVVARVQKGKRLNADQVKTIYRGLAPLGFLGTTIPREAGGAGMSYVDLGILLEALAPAPVILGEVVPPRTIYYLGTDEQMERWLPGLLSGELLSTAAITEPQAGSDVRNLQTTAVCEGDRYLLNGRKKYIKLGGVADLMTVLAVTSGEGHEEPGTSRLVAERGATPWTSRELDSVGMRNLSFSEVTFENASAPVQNLLGVPGKGIDAFYRGIEASRALVGMQATGIGRSALDIAVSYARERTAFGRPLAKFQAIQIALADAATELDAARLLCLKALWKLDTGERCPQEASMAKVFATETVVSVCHVAMDCMGAMGLLDLAGAERCWRDARMLTVIDGASGIQRLIVGREILGTAAFA